MPETIRHGIIMLMVGIVIGAGIMAVAVADVADAASGDDAPAIANCIAEYDYQHPKGTRWGNLVQGIRWCNLVEDGMTHACLAPCRVTFGKGMEEDMLKVDYARGTLRVWRGSPDAR